MRSWASPHRVIPPTGVKPSGRIPSPRTSSLANPRPVINAAACAMPADLSRNPVIMITLPDPAPKAVEVPYNPQLLGVEPRQKSLRSPTRSPTNIPHLSGPFLLAHIPDDPVMPQDCDVFFFRTKIKGQWAHALADSGASENFMSASLANSLALQLHVRKRALWLRIANGQLA